jgi:hypothetical protein
MGHFARLLPAVAFVLPPLLLTACGIARHRNDQPQVVDAASGAARSNAQLQVHYIKPMKRSTNGLEPIRLNADGSGFELAVSGESFRPWGVNYDHDTRGRLLEDYWVEEWDTVVGDFREMRELGANTVRIHLQFGKFMLGPDRSNTNALIQLERLLVLASDTGLHLDLTGLGCYHKQDVPAWYDAMDEPARWQAQANFWTAVARTCRGHNAVFCYDLMNEPIIGGNAAEGWLTGELGGKHFVQRLTLDPGERTPREIAAAWARKLTAAIRREDPDHLITVGVIPWAMVWPGAEPIFYSPEVARHLDFASVHFYPKSGEIDKALAALAVYDIGKPLVIEEMFPLACGIEEIDAFIKGSMGIAEGWISFYWGRSLAEYEALEKPLLVDALMTQWLRHFRESAPQMRRP